MVLLQYIETPISSGFRLATFEGNVVLKILVLAFLEDPLAVVWTQRVLTLPSVVIDR